MIVGSSGKAGMESDSCRDPALLEEEVVELVVRNLVLDLVILGLVLGIALYSLDGPPIPDP